MKKLMMVCLTASIGLSLVGCSTSMKPEVKEKKIVEIKKKVEVVKNKTLDLDYATKFPDVNQITYPHFYFKYNDDFSVTSHDCDMDVEKIVFENNKGTTVTYTNYSLPESFIPTGSHASMSKIKVTKVADADFTPGYVQATSYENLGPFVVAKCEEIGTMNMQTDSDYTDVKNGRVFYALLPENALGIRETNYTQDMEFCFYYGGFVSVLAMSSDNTYSKQDVKDIVDMLKVVSVEK